MCKVMIMTGLENSPKALEFMKAAAKPMSRMDRDGIGYSAINSQNKLFMQKWHKNDDFLKTDSVVDANLIAELAQYQDRLQLKENYTSYGEITLDDLKTVTMHTRWATCGREFENTHPFIDQETSLIHNGTINNCKVLNLNKISTCDSEAALQVYLNKQIGTTPLTANIQSFIDELSGYWAFGILAKDVNGQYILDVVRESAQLYFCKVPDLGKNCYVFATTQDIITESLKETGLTSSKIEFLKESYYIRFNAITGEIVDNYKLGKSKSNKSYSSYSNYIKEETTESYFDKKKTTEIDDELDYFTDNRYKLVNRLAAYDDFMNSNYFNTLKDMPNYMEALLVRAEKFDKLPFEQILLVLEFYQKEKDVKETIKLLNTKASA